MSIFGSKSGESIFGSKSGESIFGSKSGEKSQTPLFNFNPSAASNPQ